MRNRSSPDRNTPISDDELVAAAALLRAMSANAAALYSRLQARPDGWPIVTPLGGQQPFDDAFDRLCTLLERRGALALLNGTICAHSDAAPGDRFCACCGELVSWE